MANISSFENDELIFVILGGYSLGLIYLQRNFAVSMILLAEDLKWYIRTDVDTFAQVSQSPTQYKNSTEVVDSAMLNKIYVYYFTHNH